MLVIGRMVILIPSYDGSYGNDINGIGKTSENEQKIMFFFIFCLLLKAGRHAKAGQLPEGVPQNCLFWLIFYKVDVKLFTDVVTTKQYKRMR